MLAEAISRQVVVEFDYTDSGLDPSSPRVAPAQLIVRDGFGYLQAWSLQRAAWRTYRLDRIGDVRITNEPAGDHGAPPEFGAGWLEQRPDAAEVTLRLAPERGMDRRVLPDPRNPTTARSDRGRPAGRRPGLAAFAAAAPGPRCP